MTFVKFSHGEESRIDLNTTPFDDGRCYITYNGNCYVDMNTGTEDDPNNQRIQLNAADSQTLDGHSLSDIKAYVDNNTFGMVNGAAAEFANYQAAEIRPYAFYKHQAITSADYPVATQIGNYAFYQCPSLQSVNTPSVTTVGSFAFRGCTSLPSVDLPLATTIGGSAFDECNTLSSINIPLVAEIEAYTFRKCEALASVELPSATVIGVQAFWSSGIISLTLSGNTVCALEDTDAFAFTAISEGTGQIRVPSSLVDSYKHAEHWSAFADMIVAI